jgi:hypothetical protein
MSETSKVSEESNKKTNSDVEGKKESTRTVKKGKIIGAHIDSDPKELLEWTQKGATIAFDPDDLPVLSDEELQPFPYSTVKAFKEAQGEKKKKGAESIEVLDTLGGSAGNKLKLRKRRGYHQTWKRPDELDDAREKGYIVIREPKKDGEKAGAETGSIKRIGKEDNAELIAMEVSQERYDNHIKIMTKKSRRAYTANKERFAGNVEQLNRNLPKADRLKVIDDEGDVG